MSAESLTFCYSLVRTDCKVSGDLRHYSFGKPSQSHRKPLVATEQLVLRRTIESQMHLLTKGDAVGDGRLCPVPPSGELDERYASSLILPIRSKKHEVIHKTGSTQQLALPTGGEPNHGHR